MGHEGYGVFHDELGCVSTTCPHFPASSKIETVNCLLVKYVLSTTGNTGMFPRPRIQSEGVLKRSGPSPEKFRRPLSISGQAGWRRLPLDDGYCAQLGVLARYSLTDRAKEREADEARPCGHAPSSRSARSFWFTASHSDFNRMFVCLIKPFTFGRYASSALRSTTVGRPFDRGPARTVSKLTIEEAQCSSRKTSG